MNFVLLASRRMNIMFGSPFETVPKRGTVCWGADCKQQKYFNVVNNVSFDNHIIPNVKKAK
jgi:hypothetical protein